nr:leucine-rich repeat domain-containing protein [uncultured Mogibacterium sp.]
MELGKNIARKIIVFLLTFVIIAGYSTPLMTTYAGASDTPDEFFDFNASTKTIVGYSDRADAPKNVVIPSVINGTPVEKIGPKAFAGHQLTSVVIPSSVKEIGDEGFSGNTALSSITLNEGLTSMGNRVFGKTSITSINIPASLTKLGEGAFYRSSSLTTVNFATNSQLKSIEAETFEKTAVKNITIPDSVTSIGNRAFLESSIENVTFGTNSNLNEINHYAFYGTPLKTVTLPQKVKSIGGYSFGNTKIKTITIPDSVTTIDTGAFSDTDLLKEIKIPTKNRGEITGEPWQNKVGLVYWKDVLKIDSYVYDVTQKKIVKYIGTTPNAEIDIPNQLEKDGVKYPVEGILSYAFYDADIVSVNIPNSVKNIDRSAFEGVKKPIDITFSPNSKLRTIPNGAFYYTKIKSIELPNTIEAIDQHAFKYAEIKSIAIPDSVKKIGWEAFGSSNLEKITFGTNSKLNEIDGYAFSSSRLKEIILPETVNRIGVDSFNRTNLKTITIPDAVTSIEQGAFSDTDLLKEIKIPTKHRGEITGEPWGNKIGIVYWKDVMKIGSYIYDVKNKKIVKYIGTTPNADIDIPNQLEKDGVKYPVEGILSYAFYGADISSVNIPNSVKAIDYNAFEGVKNPIDVTFSTNSKLKNLPTGSFARSKIKSIELPETLETIERDAFTRTEIKNITIPDSVKKIEPFAFSETTLENITFGENSKLEEIGDWAFRSAPLKAVILPDTVKTIGGFAFSGTKLKTITIPNGVTHFGSNDASNGVLESPDLETVYVRNSRQRFPSSAGQPWGGPATTKVYYEGEFVEFTHTIDKVANEFKRVINIKGFIPDNSTAIIQNIELPNGTVINLAEKNWPADLSSYLYPATQNGTYIFKGTHSSGSVREYVIKIDDIGTPIIDGEDAVIHVSKVPPLQKADVLKLVKAKAKNEINTDLTNSIVLTDADYDKVKALTRPGDYTDITLKVTDPLYGKSARKTVRITVIADPDPIIPDPTPATDDDKPSADYVTVLFKKGTNGSLAGTTKYYVLKDGNYKVNALTKPSITADTGWHVATPSWLDDANVALDDNTLIDRDLTYTAQYKKDNVVVPTPGTPGTPGISVTPTPGTSVTPSTPATAGPKANVVKKNTRRLSPRTGDASDVLVQFAILLTAILGLLVALIWQRKGTARR